MLAREKEVNTKSQYQKQFRIDSIGERGGGGGVSYTFSFIRPSALTDFFFFNNYV